MLESLANTIKEKIESTDPPASASKTSVEKLAWFINKARDTQRKLVFAIDHVESLFSSLDLFGSRNRIVQARHNLFAAITKTLGQGNVIWILFARSEHFFLMFPTPETQRAANITWVRLSEFSREECVLLVERLSSIAGRSLTSDAIQVFVDNVPRTPQGVVLSFLSLIALSSESEIGDREVVERRPWDDVFRQDYEGLMDDEKAIVYAIASLMESTSRRLFTSREIHKNLPAHDRPQLSAVDDVLHGLQENKYLVYQPVAGKYVLYHLNFARYVISRQGGVIQTAETSERFTEYAGLLAHEVRNSLGDLMRSIGYFRDDISNDENLWLHEKTNARLRDHIEKLDLLVRKMSQRIRAADFASRGPEQQHSYTTSPVDLELVLQRVIRLFRSNDRAITYAVKNRTGAMLIVYGDAGLIETVLYQVIDNATKYSFTQTTVFIDMEERDSRVVVTVRNTGIRVRPEEQERVFQPGYRGKEATWATASGSGWGMYIASSIMKSFGGEARIRTDPDGDVIVTLTFPTKERTDS